jgi:hypothetical protein
MWATKNIFDFKNVLTPPDQLCHSTSLVHINDCRLSQWVKQVKHDADHSLPSTVKVKNVWSFTFILLHGVVLKQIYNPLCSNML